MTAGALGGISGLASCVAHRRPLLVLPLPERAIHFCPRCLSATQALAVIAWSHEAGEVPASVIEVLPGHVGDLATLCAGCSVRSPYEHRCTGYPCGCQELFCFDKPGRPETPQAFT